MSGARTDLE